MNTPKKPGTDLAALKARLAKKTHGEEPAAAPPPAAAPAPQAAQAPPAPSHHGHAVPAPGMPMHVPPPGMQHHPSQSYDAPAAQAYPEPSYPGGSHEPQAPSSPAVVGYSAPASDDPFGGGMVNPNYDPSPSFDASDVPGRSRFGAVLFACVLGLGIGGSLGWLGQRVVSGRERSAAGREKGADMVKQVEGIVEARKAVSLALETAKDVVVQDPKKGAAALVEISTEHFDKSTKIDNLFSWQLAAIHKAGITKTFELYEHYNRLRTDLGVLAGFLEANAATLAAAGGPVRFAILFGERGAQMVEYVAPLCPPAEGPPAEGAAALAAAKPCQDESKSIGLSIRTEIGAEPKPVAKGTGPDQAVPLTNEGTVFTYAIGLEPNKHALTVRQSLMKRVQDDLTEMSRAEVVALKALQNYSDSPTVDGASPEQPAPE